MSVTIDYAQLADESCLPQGRSRFDYEIARDRDILIIPGNTFSMSLRVTAGDPVEVKNIAPDGTIETLSVHGLAVGDPIHLCFYSGIAKSQISPWIVVKTVVDDHHFTIADADGEPVNIKKEILLGEPTEKQPELCGWIAKAANLKGFSAAIVIDLDTGRRDAIIGSGAIRKDDNMLSIKGAWDIRKGDILTLGDYSSCVKMSRTVNSENGCFTVAQMAHKASADTKFTDGKLATIEPLEPLLEAIGWGDEYGWVNVTMPGSTTLKLDEYRKPNPGKCNQMVGRFRLELRAFSMSYPSWFKKHCTLEPTWTRVFDYGKVWI